MKGSLPIDFSEPTLYYALASIVFNPLYWNIVARREYRTHFITNLFGGAYPGCYALAFSIFTLGIFRDWLFTVAMDHQGTSEMLAQDLYQYLGAALVISGNVFVLSSMWRLGITGTYLGDYFGILMKERVTSFPFNVMENPMYNGSTMVFLGTALWRASPAGVFISVVVFVVYQIALGFEGPFTGMIYSNKNKQKVTSPPTKRRTKKD
ncbi:phospholipid methyltransferase-domain-containing protein [Paraphysoderma sedebokerense]|nr:phospholipid methyltransferase-domain-containing protein [Paraphysoderma sedebokerense]